MKGFSAQVATSNEEAERCGRMADNASTDQLRADYLRCQSSWLRLAEAYEEANRLLFNPIANKIERRPAR
ncbi:MAG TPA: hypothetical protein VH206_14915 [Xanthobacteraceae bacterium]|nr:hypothetical protein [Xanthobacteraceae bacterium]